MKLWRISNHPELNGRGGQLASGRWHTQGRPIIYLAEHVALAQLEALAHLDVVSAIANFQLAEVEVPNDVDLFMRLDRQELPENWEEKVEDERIQGFGDAWLASVQSLFLAVPSAVCPHGWNYLMNPLHRDASRVQLRHLEKYFWDRRLLRVRSLTL